MEPGDVIIVLQQEPHAVFERSGDNLIMKHKINLVESLCGFELVITHLDGRQIVLKHPPNDPIAPGKLISIFSSRSIHFYSSFVETFRCVKGQGMINMRTHDTGDLIVQFDVEFPGEKTLTDPKVLHVRHRCERMSLDLLDRCFRTSKQFYRNAKLLTFRKVNM